MYRFFVAAQEGDILRLRGETEHHVVDVLRLPWGTTVEAVTPDGRVWRAEVAGAPGKGTWLRAVELLPASHEPCVRLALAQGLAKGEKMDFIVQKAVELGVTDVYPVALASCVVKLSGSKAQARVERWQKIAAAAAQQAKRDVVPVVHPVCTLAELLATDANTLRLVAYENEQQQGLKPVLQAHAPLTDVLVLVGPEGGLTPAEVAQAQAAGAVCVSLGQRILRTETAGLVALAAILYETGEFGE